MKYKSIILYIKNSFYNNYVTNKLHDIFTINKVYLKLCKNLFNRNSNYLSNKDIFIDSFNFKNNKIDLNLHRKINYYSKKASIYRQLYIHSLLLKIQKIPNIYYYDDTKYKCNNYSTYDKYVDLIKDYKIKKIKNIKKIDKLLYNYLITVDFPNIDKKDSNITNDKDKSIDNITDTYLTNFFKQPDYYFNNIEPINSRIIDNTITILNSNMSMPNNLIKNNNSLFFYKSLYKEDISFNSYYKILLSISSPKEFLEYYFNVYSYLNDENMISIDKQNLYYFLNLNGKLKNFPYKLIKSKNWLKKYKKAKLKLDFYSNLCINYNKTIYSHNIDNNYNKTEDVSLKDDNDNYIYISNEDKLNFSNYKKYNLDTSPKNKINITYNEYNSNFVKLENINFNDNTYTSIRLLDISLDDIINNNREEVIKIEYHKDIPCSNCYSVKVNECFKCKESKDKNSDINKICTDKNCIKGKVYELIKKQNNNIKQNFSGVFSDINKCLDDVETVKAYLHLNITYETKKLIIKNRSDNTIPCFIYKKEGNFDPKTKTFKDLRVLIYN